MQTKTSLNRDAFWHLAKGISIITTAPNLALLAFSWVFANQASTIDHPWGWYLFTILCLTVIPLLAYPISWHVPSLKKQGRHGERKAAFVAAAVGWFGGLGFGLASNAPWLIKMIFATYCVNVVVLTIVNRVLSFKASGHAAGAVGPVVLLSYLVGNAAWATLAIVPAVFWARLHMGRHTKRELVGGTACGVVSTVAVIIAMS